MKLTITIGLANDGRLFFRENHHEHTITVNENMNLRVFDGYAKSPITDLLDQ